MNGGNSDCRPGGRIHLVMGLHGSGELNEKIFEYNFIFNDFFNKNIFEL
jgi:hypothetical protein